MLYYVLFFSLDQLATKNQKLNSKWSLDKARLSSSLFKLKRQQITLADIWWLVTGHNEKNIYISLILSLCSCLQFFLIWKKKCFATLPNSFIIQHCLSKSLKTVLMKHKFLFKNHPCCNMLYRDLKAVYYTGVVHNFDLQQEKTTSTLK